MFIPIADVLGATQLDAHEPPLKREKQTLHDITASRTPSHTSRTRLMQKDVRDASLPAHPTRIARERETGNLREESGHVPPAWAIGQYADVPSFGRHTANVYVDI